MYLRCSNASPIAGIIAVIFPIRLAIRLLCFDSSREKMHFTKSKVLCLAGLIAGKPVER
jgi:hypothetical protein